MSTKTPMKTVLTTRHSMLDTQRKYTWKKNGAVITLWNDLSEFYTEFGSNHSKKFDLGYMRFYENGDVFEVVDGQQRITTFMILCAAIRDYCYYDVKGNRNDPALNQIISQTTSVFGSVDPFNPSEDYLNLLVADDAAEYFRNIIVGVNPKWKYSVKPEDCTLMYSARIMDEAYRLLRTKVRVFINGYPSEERIDTLLKFTMFILNRVVVTTVEDPDRETARISFENINSKGQALEPTDIIKNALMVEMNDPLYLNKWKQIEDVFDDPEEFCDYVYRVWKGRTNITQKKMAYDIGNRLEEYADWVDFINELEQKKDIYLCAIGRSDRLGFKADSYEREILTHLSDLRDLGSATHYPLYLVMAVKCGKADIASVLDYLVKIKAGYAAFGKNPNGLESVLTKLANKVYCGEITQDVCKELTGMAKDIHLPPATVAAGLMNKKFPRTESTVPKFYLRKAEGLNDRDKPSSNTDTQLEHICPKNPDFDKGEWLAFKDCHEEYAFRLGNMTLLNPQDNNIGSNDPFIVKQEIAYMPSTFRINEPLKSLEQVDWLPSDVDKRGEYLVGRIMEWYGS